MDHQENNLCLSGINDEKQLIEVIDELKKEILLEELIKKVKN